MRVFRLSKRKYSSQFSGKGAAKSGNRWNSKGTEIIYCGESRSLVMAEVVVHLSIATLPSDYVMIEIDIPEEIAIHSIDTSKLPLDWNIFPHNLETQLIGDDFINANKKCILKVPSSVVEGDFNYLINPFHPEFSKIKIIKISDFKFDRRFFE